MIYLLLPLPGARPNPTAMTVIAAAAAEPGIEPDFPCTTRVHARCIVMGFEIFVGFPFIS